MATSHGSTGRALLGGYHVSAYLNEVTTGMENDTPESTVFTSTDKEYIPGLADATVSATGPYFDGTAEVGAIVSSLKQVNDVTFVHLPYGDTAGNFGRAIAGDITKFEITTPVADVNKAVLEMDSSVDADRVVVLKALTSGLTGGGTATGINNSAATTNGGAGYINCTALTGGTAAVKIQHSSDDLSYVDLVTFTNITTANSYERSAVASGTTVNQYLREVHTVTGGTATIHVCFGRR